MCYVSGMRILGTAVDAAREDGEPRLPGQKVKCIFNF